MCSDQAKDCFLDLAPPASAQTICAWLGGLRELYESEKKAVLPPFDREVRTLPHHAVPSNTETCSHAMPTTTGSQ